ncbi:MAG TPA: hypothetical protein VGZ25_03960 [Gemmataceae bacterium]|nr:hypothetical protein [Gemmataceae bacterium]
MPNRVPSYHCKKSNGRKYGCVSFPDGVGGRKDILLGKPSRVRARRRRMGGLGSPDRNDRGRRGPEH